ncbi:hypothetical protein NKH45_21230 [Mesorhizobium sp. M1156]|uniref:hypothetical protein n=1 Tax=Mesorhizobium sp. M1156 TaxID=2957064 RepID=UPI003339DD1D
MIEIARAGGNEVDQPTVARSADEEARSRSASELGNRHAGIGPVAGTLNGWNWLDWLDSEAERKQDNVKLLAKPVPWRGEWSIQIGELDLVTIRYHVERRDLMAYTRLQPWREPDHDVIEAHKDVVTHRTARSGLPVQYWQVCNGIRRVMRRPVVDMRIEPSAIGRRLERE